MLKIIRHISIFIIILLLFSVTAGADSLSSDVKIKGAHAKTDSSTSETFAPEELLVQFSAPQTDEKIAKKVEKFYGKETKKTHTIAFDYSDLGLPNTYLLKLSATEDPKEVKEKYKQDPEVVYAEPNYVVTIELLPDDASFSYLWGLHNTGQRGNADADIDAPEAWDICTGSREVIVAVIDTGVDYQHPDLASNSWVNTGEIPGNSIDDDGNGYVDDIRGWDFYNHDNNPMDDNGHGTHCAGIIGAVGNNGEGVAGIMWQTKIMPLKFASSSGSGYTSDAAAAILYADMMGADVISNSWGGSGYSITLENAIASSSALVVCAAGNDAENIDSSPFYPASFSSPQVLAVAASTATDTLASFSNYGSSSVDVAAPGEYIYSTLRSGSYGFMSGTSMATPHVAGVAGLLNAYSPGLPNSVIKAAILDGVDQKTSLSGKVLTSGRINAYTSLGLLPPASLSITGITPSSAPNTSPVSVTISGTGFNLTPDMKLSGTADIPATDVIFISSTQLIAHFELTGRATGLYDLVVTNPDASSVTWSEGFEILPPPPPAVSEISPSSTIAGGSDFILVVSGTGFTPVSEIVWNEIVCSPTLFINATHLSTLIPASCITNPGTVSITVFDPTRGISNIAVFTTAPSLGCGLDAPALTWTTGGNANWFPENSVYYYDNDAAESGDIGNSQTSSLQTTVTGPGTLSFWWKVSSESGDDFLRFYLDGVQQTRISGEVDWRQQSYPLAAGTHTLEWRYTKDGGTSRGSDCGWVDKVEFILPELTPPESVTGLHNTTFLTNSVTWAWTDPSTVDFDRVMVYLNGVFRTNVTRGTQTYTASGLTPATGYILSTHTVSTTGQVNTTWVNHTATTAAVPLVPPGSITGLHNTTFLTNSVTWAWTDPSTIDFDRVMIYLNGVFQANVSKGVRGYTASGLTPATGYTLSTHTVSTTGQVNTTWVNHTATTAAVPAVPPDSISGLHNTTFLTNAVTWAWTDPATIDFDRVMVYLNGVFQTNVSKGVRGYTASGLTPATGYTLSTHTVSTTGQVNTTWVNHTATTAASANSLGEAVDAPSLTWTMGGNANWFPENSVYYYDNDAAESGDIDNSQTSSFQTTVTGPGTISFWWKVSSESRYDYLRFYLDGVQQTRISGEVDWRQQSYSLTAGTHSLEWRYTKNSATSRGSDCGWVDKVEFIPPDITPPGSVSGLHNTTFMTNSVTWAWDDPEDSDFNHVLVYLNGVFQTNVARGTQTYTAPGLAAGTPYTINTRTVDSAGNINSGWVNHTTITAPAPNLGDAVDASALPWTTGGNANWFGESSTWYFDNDAAESGDIGDSQTSSLRTTVTGPGTIYFWWKVSSESRSDYLRFYLDGVQQTRISGEVDWRQQSYSLTAGTHSLEWRYTKNSGTSRGSDCGWVDKVEVS